MAFFAFFLILCLLLFLPSTNCISSPESQHTQTVRLNHHDTIQAIEDFMAFDAGQLLQESIQVPATTTTTSSSSSPFQGNYIPVYDIDIFLKSGYEDYRSLILFRLARNAKRFEWLSTSLTDSPVVDIPYYYESASYVGIMDIGNPPQRAHLLIDTGSRFVWWDCQPCNNCPTFSYNPSRSSSYRQVDCRMEGECPGNEGLFWGCDMDGNNKCEFKVMYRDSTEAEGFLAYEKVTTTHGEEGGDVVLVENLRFGCAEKSPASMIGKKFTGILGFGPNTYSFIYQMNATSFSFCPKSHTASVATSLYFNSLPIPDDFTFRTPLLQNIQPIYYAVNLTGVYVRWEFLEIKSLTNSDGRVGAVVDSGTSISMFPLQFYNQFRDTFTRHSQWLSRLPGEQFFDTCYNISSPEWYLEVPEIIFQFSGVTGHEVLRLDANQIMMPIGTDGKYCLAFSPTKFRQFTLIGTWQLQGTRVSFDLANQMLQFDPENCKNSPS
nr:protein ASPARTIC PROTEASE IN GUARD CELL 1-like [Coffea arabica]